MPRYLTKTRFALAAECPTKLNYTGKPEYLDTTVDDTFLAALAEGGYQVGQLACLMHPGGVRVHELEYGRALARTTELLQANTITVFEAALTHGPYFVRVDILKKDGNRFDLIEVKAKSYSREDGELRGKRGDISAKFKPYLLDVAFQCHVARLAMPDADVRAYLMLVDKDTIATVDRLNNRFKIRRVNGRLHIDYVAPEGDGALGDPLLTIRNVDSQVDQLVAEGLAAEAGRVTSFEQAVMEFANAYAADCRIAPAPSARCGTCQFKADRWPADGEPRSGFHECWSQAFNLGPPDFAAGTVLDLWNCRRKDQLIAQGVLKLAQVTSDLLDHDGTPPGVNGLTTKHRQWYLCRPDWPGGGDFYFDAVAMRQEMARWMYPLHFIDFETCTVAIPFTKGRRPYSVIAFQFSHHVVEAAGTLSHRTQWLCAEPGVDPNFDFVRALRQALNGDSGTVFRWADHENTVLTHIREQMLQNDQKPGDADELVAFIDSITKRGDAVGVRNMVDLCGLSGKHFFHPSTKGSASLKKVLPALMQSSPRLRELYGMPNYGSNISLNVVQPIAWWQERDGHVLDPYSLLPPLFDDFTREEVDALEEGLPEELREGGAAMAAYARLQAEDLEDDARASIKAGLLRYCELDSLAMVMAVQAWQGWAEQ